MAERTTFHGTLLDGESALNTAAELGPGRVAQSREVGLYIVFNASVTAGAVVVEGAHVSGYAGTWANLATVNWVAATRVHYVAITGVHLNLRVRISSAIVGGTVDAHVVGN